MLGLQSAQMLGGSVVIESVFAVPGLGRLAQEAVAARDTPLLLGIILTSAVLVIVINLARRHRLRLPRSARRRQRGRRVSPLRRFLRTPEAVAGAILLAVLFAMALSAPLLFPGDPQAIAGPALLPPFQDWSLPLGTDRLGRDVLAELFHGARTSLAVGLAAAAAALVIGAVVGTLAGFAGGLVDEVLMRITDAFQTVPSFLLALAFVSVVGPSLGVVVAGHRARRLDRTGACGARRSAVASASAIMSPAPASSACIRWRSPFARCCPTPCRRCWRCRR